MHANITSVARSETQKTTAPFDPYRKRSITSAAQFSSVLNKALATNGEADGKDIDAGTSSKLADELLKLIRQNESSRPQYAYQTADAAENIVNAANTAHSFTNISADEKAYFDAIRPDFYDDKKYLEVLTDYDESLSLLNPENLPETASGFQLVTWPQPGKSVSTDMVELPTFSETTGGIMRTDYTLSGKVYSFIPVTEWRQVNSGRDAAVGTVYSQQLPWGFRCYFDRGGGAPVHLGYEAGKYDSRLEEYLATTETENKQELLAKIQNSSFTGKYQYAAEEEKA